MSGKKYPPAKDQNPRFPSSPSTPFQSWRASHSPATSQPSRSSHSVPASQYWRAFYSPATSRPSRPSHSPATSQPSGSSHSVQASPSLGTAQPRFSSPDRLSQSTRHCRVSDSSQLNRTSNSMSPQSLLASRQTRSSRTVLTSLRSGRSECRPASQTPTLNRLNSSSPSFSPSRTSPSFRSNQPSEDNLLSQSLTNSNSSQSLPASKPSKTDLLYTKIKCRHSYPPMLCPYCSY